ncbi:hypothetical protein ACHQM5_023399 [Ranunculus cassubicifolius]
MATKASWLSITIFLLFISIESIQEMKKSHFVLIHGASHGAWCWYKVETLLKSAGHQVTSLDMASSGINHKQYKQVHSDLDLYEPLTKFMEKSVAAEDNIILVGHSYAGIGISMAMESFPEKISVAVFITAAMPGPTLSLADIGKEVAKEERRSEMDNQYGYDDGVDKPATSLSYGPKFLSTYMYQLCAPEDLTLATKLLRTVHLYQTGELALSKEKYGWVKRDYVVTDQDKVWAKNIQHYMVRHNLPELVKEIKGSDHMVMLSKPHELSIALQAIAEHFSGVLSLAPHPSFYIHS